MRSIFKWCLLLFSVLLFNACGAPATKKTPEKMANNKNTPTRTLLYVGTYTKKEGHVDGKADGIYILEMDRKTGALTALDTIKNTINPSYLTVHPNKKYLYAANELVGDDLKSTGTISAYELDKDGLFSKVLNVAPAAGDAPCHVSVDATGKYLLSANYMGANVAALPINTDGSLGEAVSVAEHKLANPPGGRQEAAHPHIILPAVDKKSVFVADLGMDEVVQYRLENGQLEKLAATKLTAGAGPRHIDFHPSQKRMYVLNELNQTIEVFTYQDVAQPFEHIQTISTITEPISEGSIGTSAIHIHPSGQFLYAANRGIEGNTEQSIAMFSVDENSGKLALLGLQNTKGEVPRDFMIDPSGRFLLVGNQDTDTIVTFTINQKTGILEETGLSKKVATPVCLKFVEI
ncbi:MAG: lactonase family protein [Bacteroidota bacterium]